MWARESASSRGRPLGNRAARLTDREPTDSELPQFVIQQCRLSNTLNAVDQNSKGIGGSKLSTASISSSAQSLTLNLRRDVGSADTKRPEAKSPVRSRRSIRMIKRAAHKTASEFGRSGSGIFSNKKSAI